MKNFYKTINNSVPSIIAKINLVILMVVFSATFVSAQPQAFAPNLGNAATFAVFGGGGGVTNQGQNTILHGSLGTTSVPTTVTGFTDGVTNIPYTTAAGANNGNVTGGIYSNSDATSFAFASQTMLDINSAYGAISPASQPGGMNLGGTANLGGLTLTPGVYKAVDFIMSGSDLTLDAQGNPNAVWVFQSTASLTVGMPGAPRSVIMTNGGLARNVFWYVGSGAVINTGGGGIMSGTIISSAATTTSTAGSVIQTVINGRILCLNAGVTMVNTTVNACDTWTGKTNNIWNTTTNWSRGSVPIASEEVLIPNVLTPKPVVSSTTSSLFNLTIYTGSALTVTSTLQISGFINNLGNAFDATNGTITMNGVGTITKNGTLPQIIPANTFTNSNTVQNLIISDPANVTLSGDINVSSLFTLTNGLLKTGNNNLIIGNNATITGAAFNRYVDGNLRKVGNQAFTFPVGNVVYAPITMSAPLNATDHFTANYVNSTPNTLYPTASLGVGLNRVSSNEYWMLNRTNGTSNVDVTLSFEFNRSGVITTMADLRVAQWNGTQWTNQGNTATTGTNGNGTVKSNAGLTAYGPFTLGSSTASNPLPINLISFTAQKQNGIIALQWQTSNEINNDYFNIQHSSNGYNWNTIATQSAKNSTTNNYSYLHLLPIAAKNYYRLQQVDKNSSSTYSSVRVIDFGPKANIAVSVYPNPVANNTVSVDMGTDIVKPLVYRIYNTAGAVMKTGTIANRQQNVSLTGLTAGTYRLALGDGQTITIVKM